MNTKNKAGAQIAGQSKSHKPIIQQARARRIPKELSDRNRASQRAVLLEHLRRGAVSTLFARSVLGIMSPATRIFELRELGYEIQTLPLMPNSDLSVRPIALYALISEPDGDRGRMPTLDGGGHE
jgi:hypothetical protein